MKSIILTLACLLPLAAQSFSYGTIARPGAAIDFRNASTVLPDRHASADPTACTLGERYFNTTTAKTRRCIAANTWADEGGSTYTLPTATGSVLGGIKIGTGLNIDGNGVVTASTSGATCDPFDLTKYCFVEDFAYGTNTSGHVGSGGFSFTAIASGTFSPASVSAPTATTQHPGLVKITSTTVAGSGGRLVATNATTGWLNFDDQMNKEWETRWIVKLESTSDTRTRVGFVSGTGIAPGLNETSLMFRYDVDATYGDNSKNGGSGSWVAQFCGYSGGTCAGDTAGVYKVLNVAPTTGWTLFTIARSGTTYTWSINGTAVATMCASGCDMTIPSVNTPSGISIGPGVYFGISSTTQRNIFIDYYSFKMSGLTRY